MGESPARVGSHKSNNREFSPPSRYKNVIAKNQVLKTMNHRCSKQILMHLFFTGFNSYSDTNLEHSEHILQDLPPFSKRWNYYSTMCQGEPTHFLFRTYQAWNDPVKRYDLWTKTWVSLGVTWGQELMHMMVKIFLSLQDNQSDHYSCHLLYINIRITIKGLVLFTQLIK